MVPFCSIELAPFNRARKALLNGANLDQFWECRFSDNFSWTRTFGFDEPNRMPTRGREARVAIGGGEPVKWEVAPVAILMQEAVAFG
ncbi:unnamed protein product [Heligmosomoides polygyrus]|uniref:AraC family transcriptional regulator n=1 Tax=Heligmosomoides polygyrus TaxID=6339 RepID=A0A183GPP2_HELPZ|nr:unnamed protein product [Heligmosomoides polygyrus]